MQIKTERKLIAMGEGSLVVTIPKGWARYYGLKAGDRVEIVTNGDLTVRVKRTGKDNVSATTNSA